MSRVSPSTWRRLWDRPLDRQVNTAPPALTCAGFRSPGPNDRTAEVSHPVMRRPGRIHEDRQKRRAAIVGGEPPAGDVADAFIQAPAAPSNATVPRSCRWRYRPRSPHLRLARSSRARVGRQRSHANRRRRPAGCRQRSSSALLRSLPQRRPTTGWQPARMSDQADSAALARPLPLVPSRLPPRTPAGTGVLDACHCHR